MSLIMEHIEVATYFFMRAFSLPPDSNLFKIRLVVFAWFGAMVANDWHHYTRDPLCTKVPFNNYLILIVVSLEIGIIVKFCSDVLTIPPPSVVVYPWLATIGLLLVWGYFFFFVQTSPPRTSKDRWAVTNSGTYGFLPILFVTAFTPLLTLGRLYAF